MANQLTNLRELTENVYNSLEKMQIMRLAESQTPPQVGISNVILDGTTNRGEDIAFRVILQPRYSAIKEFKDDDTSVSFNVAESQANGITRYFVVSLVGENAATTPDWTMDVNSTGPGSGDTGHWVFVKSRVTEDIVK